MENAMTDEPDLCNVGITLRMKLYTSGASVEDTFNYNRHIDNCPECLEWWKWIKSKGEKNDNRA